MMVHMLSLHGPGLVYFGCRQHQHGLISSQSWASQQPREHQGIVYGVAMLCSLKHHQVRCCQMVCRRTPLIEVQLAKESLLHR